MTSAVIRRRRVCFSDEPAMVIPAAAAPDNNWYTREDRARFRACAKYLASDVRQYERYVAKELQAAYSAATHMATTSTLEEALPRIGSDTLEHWAALGMSRRGLERFVLNNKSKSTDEGLPWIQSSRNIVLNLQHLLKQGFDIQDNGSVVQGNATTTPEERADVLQKHYEEYSRAAKLFARMLGHADQKVAQESQREKTVLKMTARTSSRRRLECLARIPCKSSSQIACMGTSSPNLNWDDDSEYGFDSVLDTRPRRSSLPGRSLVHAIKLHHGLPPKLPSAPLQPLEREHEPNELTKEDPQQGKEAQQESTICTASLQPKSPSISIPRPSRASGNSALARRVMTSRVLA